MVGIVQGVDERFVKWMYVVEAGKAIKDCLQFFRECLLREADFARVEASNTRDLEPSTYLRWKAPLGPR